MEECKIGFATILRKELVLKRADAGQWVLNWIKAFWFFPPLFIEAFLNWGGAPFADEPAIYGSMIAVPVGGNSTEVKYVRSDEPALIEVYYDCLQRSEVPVFTQENYDTTF